MTHNPTSDASIHKMQSVVFHVTQIVGLLFLLLVICPQSAAAEAKVTADGTRWTIGNASVQRVIETKPFLHTVLLTNRTVDQPLRYAVESRGFRLSCNNDQFQVTGTDFISGTPKVEKNESGVHLIVPLTCEKYGIKVNVIYFLAHDAFYLRKHLEIDPGKHLLNWVDVEQFRLAGVEWERFDQKPAPYLRAKSAYGGMLSIRAGRPLFADGKLFLGVEHPASINSFDKEGWISLRQHPGRKGKFSSSPAVIGVSPDRPRQRLLDSFWQYIDENRDRKVKSHLAWTVYFEGSGAYDAKVTDKLCQEKIELAKNVFRKRGVNLDAVIMSGVWSNPQSIMAINPRRPNRMALVTRLCRQHLDADLGLHVITSGKKSWVDKDWLAKQGYDMIWHRSRTSGALCLADPRVMGRLQENLVDYTRLYNCSACYFDWAWYVCGQAGHRGHVEGDAYGLDAIATKYMQLMRTLRKANPEIVLYNSGWFSPWLLWHYDAVFCGGGDYGYALAGPPSYNTVSLLCSWRDENILGNIVQWSPYFPLNSIWTAEPIGYQWFDWNVRSESPVRAVADYFVTAASRGGQLLDVHSNIAAWSEDHSDAAAAVLRWMQANDDVLLAYTRFIGGSPGAGDPYGYAHFNKRNRGIIMVRNPGVEPREIDIRIDETAGAWPTNKKYVVRCVYPYTEVLAETVGYGSVVRRRLNGEEVQVLEILPLDSLPEPMPIGRRYQVTSREAGATTYRLASQSGKIEFFSPVPIENARAVKQSPYRFVTTTSAMKSPNAVLDGIKPLKTRVEKGQYIVTLELPQGAVARVSFLFRQRGITGQLFLDGKPIEADAPHLRLADSKGRTDGLRAGAREWSLFGIDVTPGKHELRFTPESNATDQKVQIVADFRADLTPTRSVKIKHSTIKRENSPEQLPRNWAWQDRRTTISSVASTKGDPQNQFVEFQADHKTVKMKPIQVAPPSGTLTYDRDSMPLVLNKPAVLKLGSARYLLDKEGLYRIRDEATSKIVGQSILCQGDVWRLASHLCRLTVYADRHSGETAAQRDERARRGEPVSLLCGNTTQFVRRHLESQGIKSRTVQSVARGNWNYFSDGHCLMEIYDAKLKRWVLFDPSFAVRLSHEGQLLNLLEASRLYREGKRPDKVEFLNAEGSLDTLFSYKNWIGRYSADGETISQFAGMFRAACRNDSKSIHKMFNHILTVPFIGKCFVVNSDEEEKLFRTLWPNYTRMTEEDFQVKFYSHGSPLN